MSYKSNLTSAEFIKEKLQLLADTFTTVTVRYAYDNAISTHIVELTPEEEYYNNTALDKFWIPISLDFKRLFENEDITFISSDSILKISDPVFEWNTGGKIAKERSHFQFSPGVSPLPGQRISLA